MLAIDEAKKEAKEAEEARNLAEAAK